MLGDVCINENEEEAGIEESHPPKVEAIISKCNGMVREARKGRCHADIAFT